jgi:ABC-2 type transport system permease protein
MSIQDLSTRRVPPYGGFNATLLRLEIRRLLRNRRTMIFTVLMPVVFFLIFGLNADYASQNAGHGNVSAFILISMALYGAILATTTGGAMVSIERGEGWSRQLRLTPLAPLAYVAVKMLTALVLGGLSVVSVYVVGLVTGRPRCRRPCGWPRPSRSGWAPCSSRRSGSSWATCCRPRTSCRSCPSR